MRACLFASLLALSVPIVPAGADPADPPRPDTVRAWVVEWAGSVPRVQEGVVTFLTPDRDRALLAIVPFEVRGGRRELFGGYFAHFAGSTPNHHYPSIWHGGSRELVPPCRVRVTCEDVLPRDVHTKGLSGNEAVRQSFYVVAHNVDVQRITTSPGWRAPREIAPPKVRMIRQGGAGARVNWVGVEHFTAASAPGGPHGSVAFGWIPCSYMMGRGSAVLTGGDPIPAPYSSPYYDEHRAQCDPYWPGALGATNRATAWRLEGEVTGYTTMPDRLMVVDLPPFRSSDWD